MGISDNDVQKQLRHMMAFIEQEANEKAEEIDAKAEEEFNIEKGRLVQQQRQKIMEFYEKKEKQAREDHIRNVLEEARMNLSKISADQARYPAILKGLIMQARLFEDALLQLLEKEVLLQCREKDLHLVERLLPECLDSLEKEWGEKTSVTIDKQHYLPIESAGGVVLSSKGGKIKVLSTLESRLDLIASQVGGLIIPQIRTALFGPNQNRKFFD
uniref:V-type proton ATPase subunit E n=1 Tax=Angiostrongylus cantonensis TaxID=6313 RepID=A0A0K0DHN1_ANGCA